ncbi:TetR/AcrR family transcriptional regulator [Demequina zhanjiangensis]|uniref:Helix-turn-helix domain-containing protein n=1 Tax=Demequina zhanjiangensis TaxID=3051659 RepID=A0ABT8FZB6_9MICO|nr:TetR/AcrR family transcriptional regulator [Demequina sp. SYSU T00b26]MDN4472158.1 helix-turn-helix domain-containing protein [Demequina sp. SYSU T00b26]
MSERLVPAVRRERILDTAMALTDEHGHRSLTLRSVARECGMTAPGLMHHFPTLDHLLVALVERRDKRDEAEGIESLGRRLTPRAVFDQMIDGILARPEAARLFVAVQSAAIDPSHPGHGWFVDRYAREAEHFEALFGDVVPDARGLARRCMAAVDGLQLQYLADAEGFDLREQWGLAGDDLLGDADRRVAAACRDGEV